MVVVVVVVVETIFPNHYDRIEIQRGVVVVITVLGMRVVVVVVVVDIEIVVVGFVQVICWLFQRRWRPWSVVLQVWWVQRRVLFYLQPSFEKVFVQRLQRQRV